MIRICIRSVVRSAAHGLFADRHGLRCGCDRGRSVHNGVSRAGGDRRFSAHDRCSCQRHHGSHDCQAYLRLSVSTWRFHARGLGLRGAHDIGWIADLNVARMMRSDPKLVASDLSLAALRAKYPPGSAKRVFVTAPDGHYAGWVDMAAVHDAQYDDAVEYAAVADIVGPATFYLLPSENVRTALARRRRLQYLCRGADGLADQHSAGPQRPQGHVSGDHPPLGVSQGDRCRRDVAQPRDDPRSQDRGSICGAGRRFGQLPISAPIRSCRWSPRVSSRCSIARKAIRRPSGPTNSSSARISRRNIPRRRSTSCAASSMLLTGGTGREP